MVIHNDPARRIGGGCRGVVRTSQRRRENKRGISETVSKIALDIVTVMGLILAVGFIGAVDKGDAGLVAGAIRACASLSVSGIASFVESLI